jgi:hypothetical protein
MLVQLEPLVHKALQELPGLLVVLALLDLKEISALLDLPGHKAM